MMSFTAEKFWAQILILLPLQWNMMNKRYVCILFLSFFEMGQPRPLLVHFRSFQTNNTIFTTNHCEKCPSRIGRQDSNPWPLEHKSSPISTGPGLSSSVHLSLSFLSFSFSPFLMILFSSFFFHTLANLSTQILTRRQKSKVFYSSIE